MLVVVDAALVVVAAAAAAGGSSTTASRPSDTPASSCWLALVIAVLAVVDAGLGLVAAAGSPRRIGEGLIFDLRTEVFDHVQRMPIAFFTRTQTGALVSRLNNDVIGAQQAFTSTLSGVVSQRRSRWC